MPRSLFEPVSRYFQTIQPRPTCAAVKEIPTTSIVIRNCRSRAGACSEIASGNHHLPATNSSTESSVIIQIITARTRPIGYDLLLLSSDLFLYLPSNYSKPSRETAAASRVLTPATSAAPVVVTSKTPLVDCCKETASRARSLPRSKHVLTFPSPSVAG